MWVIVCITTQEVYGPFDSEDECYLFAAGISQEPNDWYPAQVKQVATTTEKRGK